MSHASGQSKSGVNRQLIDCGLLIEKLDDVADDDYCPTGSQPSVTSTSVPDTDAGADDSNQAIRE